MTLDITIGVASGMLIYTGIKEIIYALFSEKKS